MEDYQIIDIVGSIPDPSSIKLDYSHLNEVIKYLMRQSISESRESYIAPDWDKKIAYNKLSNVIKILLDNGGLFIGDLNAYLDNNDEFMEDTVMKEIKSVYFDCHKKFPDNEEDKNNLIFYRMIKIISPKQQKPFEDAAIILISKYFAACDIFEEPK